MNNLPKIKVGIVAVSRDCFPESLSVNRRKALVTSYENKYGKGEIYDTKNFERRAARNGGDCRHHAGGQRRTDHGQRAGTVHFPYQLSVGGGAVLLPYRADDVFHDAGAGIPGRSALHLIPG